MRNLHVYLTVQALLDKFLCVFKGVVPIVPGPHQFSYQSSPFRVVPANPFVNLGQYVLGFCG